MEGTLHKMENIQARLRKALNVIFFLLLVKLKIVYGT